MSEINTTGLSCAYPLDASEAEVSALGLNGRLALSNEDQTGSYTIQSELSSFEEYGMYPDGVSTGTATYFDTTEQKAVALSIDQIPDSVIDAGSSLVRVVASLQVVRSDFSANETLVLRYLNDGTYAIAFDVAGGVLENLSEAPRQMCLFFDGNGQLGASVTYADGSTNTYETTRSFAGGPTAVGAKVTERNGVDASLAGAPVQVTLATSAGDITSPVPSGTKTICGQHMSPTDPSEEPTNAVETGTLSNFKVYPELTHLGNIF